MCGCVQRRQRDGGCRCSRDRGYAPVGHDRCGRSPPGRPGARDGRGPRTERADGVGGDAGAQGLVVDVVDGDGQAGAALLPLLPADWAGLAPLLAQPLTLRLSASGVPEALAGQLPIDAPSVTYQPPTPAGLVAVANLDADPEPLVPLYLRRPDAVPPKQQQLSAAIPRVEL